jgi:protein-L-isoaspartate(D-aspartate) O-methyltransferase
MTLMAPDELTRARAAFAECLREEAGLRSADLVRAFATVPREDFLGPGPWKVVVPSASVLIEYRDTPDADPRRLYKNVLVAIDPARRLNNGEPASLARWLDALDLAPGDRVLHVGCGLGYYTAVAAETVGGGRVVGVEIDPDLAARARENLARWANVSVVAGDGSEVSAGSFDAIFVNAGATDVCRKWTDQLAAAGRLLVPLTVGLPGMDAGIGEMLLVTRRPVGFAARFVSPVAIFHCAGARTEEAERLLQQTYARGGEGAVRSLRLDQHAADAGCWLHGPWSCISLRDP